MLATSNTNRSMTTFITPGQQYEPVLGSAMSEESLTVARLVRDRFGMMHVTLRTTSGREISAFVEQVEYAVSQGHLIPITASPPSIAC